MSPRVLLSWQAQSPLVVFWRNYMFMLRHVTSVAHAFPDRSVQLQSACFKTETCRRTFIPMQIPTQTHATSISDATWSIDAGPSALSSDGMASTRGRGGTRACWATDRPRPTRDKSGHNMRLLE